MADASGPSSRAEGSRSILDPGTPVPPSRFERICLAAIVGVVLVLGARFVLGPEERLAFTFYDDAYYYLGVARNLARGAGSTFDGLNATNGYHPLWCWLLVPILRATQEPGSALRAAATLWFLLAAAAPLALWRAIRPRTGAAGATIAAALFGLQPFLGSGLARANGLETPLYALVIALFLGAYERSIARAGLPRRRTCFALGILLGVTILTRFDAGPLAAAAACLVAIRSAGPGPLARREAAQTAGGDLRTIGWRGTAGAWVTPVVFLAAGAVLVAGPSLVWNQVRFGSPVPVSGRLVSMMAARERSSLGGPFTEANARRRAGYAARAIPGRLAEAAVADPASRAGVISGGTLAGGLTAALATALLVVAIARRRARGRLAADALALLTLFCVLHYGVYSLWLWTSGEEVYRLYYFMPETMLLAAAAGAAAGPTLERWVVRRWARRGLAAAGLTLLSFHLLDSAGVRLARTESQPGPVTERHIYGWVRNTLPADAVLGARDAGKLGFFSGRRVVNLDGLINDERLLEAIATDTEDSYVARSPIRYLVSDRPWLDGFDAARPAVPPRRREGIGEILFRIAARPGFGVREVPGAPGDWAVVEIVRGPS